MASIFSDTVNCVVSGFLAIFAAAEPEINSFTATAVESTVIFPATFRRLLKSNLKSASVEGATPASTTISRL